MKDAGLPVVRPVIDRLNRILDETGGWGYDTYDARVGKFYEFLHARRDTSKLCKLGVYALYACEFLAPITFRKLRRIKKTWDPMGNSYRAGTYLTLYACEGRVQDLDKAREILDEILPHAVGTVGQRGFALGFQCITGSNKTWNTAVPVAHYSLRTARKMLTYERLTGDPRYASMLDEVVGFLDNGLEWVEVNGLTGVAYTPEDPLQVINIWADVASLLASYDMLRGTDTHGPRVSALTRSILCHQEEDGSWPYMAKWESRPLTVDNSHTAMVLGALADIAISSPGSLRPHILPALVSGTHHWLDRFFDEETGRLWFTDWLKNQPRAVCVGDALYAIHRLRRPEVGLPEELVARLDRVADKVVAWALANLQMRNGRFYERITPLKGYAVESIRSFDGLLCDSFALYWAERTGPPAVQNRLWTI
jgi:hypothetical protein